MDSNLKKIIEIWSIFCTRKHDIECNQKYSKTLPYSFHLGCVASQTKINSKYLDSEVDKFIALMSAWGHDLIEDARMSYNDIKTNVFDILLANNTLNIYGHTPIAVSEAIADVIYSVTDEKGKNRSDRKSKLYYSELADSRLGIFVKLNDLAANRMFSKLTGSSMYKQYVKEYPNFIKKLYRQEFEEVYNYIDKI